MTDNGSPNDEEAQAQTAMRTALVAEMYQRQSLVQVGGLTRAGLQHAHAFLVHPNQVVPGNLSIIRESVIAQIITALANETGLPESYWADRTIVAVPDDASNLDSDGDR